VLRGDSVEFFETADLMEGLGAAKAQPNEKRTTDNEKPKYVIAHARGGYGRNACGSAAPGHR
jgi:hypothetical protein